MERTCDHFPIREFLSAALLGVVLATSTVVSTAAPASADTPRCVTKKEYRKLHLGMKKRRVHNIFDIRGQASGGFAGGYTRWYVSCQTLQLGGGDGGAYISYDGMTNRVVEKGWSGYA